MPDLNTSPRGTQPLVRDPAARRTAPEPSPAEQTGTESAESATSPAETAPTDRDVAATEAVSEAANGPVPDLPPGTAEGVTIQDTPLPPREPLPPNVGNIMRDVIARLLVNTRSQAAPILTAARQEAYPNQVLPRVYNDIGNDKLDGLTDTLTEALRLVAADAGVAADQLNAAVDARRAEVETAADAAEGELETAGTDEAETMSEESGEEVAEVNAAEDAQHARTTATVQAATGEGSPQVIDARRDAQLRKINRRVANIRFDYDRAKDRRHAALDQAMALQNRAYDQTATADQAAIDAEGEGQEEGSFARSLEKARIRNWANQEKRDLGTEVRRLKGVATTEINGFREATFNAGQTASDQVRDWATTKKGETTSWWDRLWARFTDWSQQAEVEAENWSVVRAGEARDATVQNMGVLAGFVQTQGQDINLETNEAFNRLSAEQQAVIRAYYASPTGNRDTIGAVAAGLKFRLAAQQKRPLIDALKAEVMAKPDSEANNLEQIGIAQTSGFSAVRISDQLYEAMFGGVTGWGTDEDKIYTNLSGLTALQGRAVRAMYQQEYGRNLDSDLASELDADNALVRARAALAGDPVMETVGALNEAMSGWGTDEDTIMRMLRGKTAEQRAQIAEEYQRRYGVSLNAALDSEMDDHDQQRAEALLAGDTSRADAIALDQAMHGGFLGWGTDEAQIESVYSDIRNDVAGQQVPDGQGGMRPMTQEEMEAEVVRRTLQGEVSYNAEYGSPGDQDSALRAAYRNELSGPDLDLANALADNDLVAADAARLERERRGFYTDDDVVNGVLENQYGRALEGLRRDP
ncbi:MAG: annexin, partial [Thiohalocapsa sp.]